VQYFLSYEEPRCINTSKQRNKQKGMILSRGLFVCMGRDPKKREGEKGE
jgi:hypothetical protein